MALGLALAPVEGRLGSEGYVVRPTLGWIYFTDHLAPHAEAMLAELNRRFPGTHWVGAVGGGVMGSGVEYFDEPAVAVLLSDLPAGSFRLFSGVAPLPPRPRWHAAQVHADPRAPDLEDLVGELAARTDAGYVFGGLAAARTRVCHVADGVWEGGLSGVAFADSVEIVSRVTQGCDPLGPTRTVTEAQGQLVVRLDDRPALDCLLTDLGVDATEPRDALPRVQHTLAALSAPATASSGRGGARAGSRPRLGGRPPQASGRALGEDTRVRHLIGIDPRGGGIAVADEPVVGTSLTFCRRDPQAARRDLVRICAEIREALEPQELWNAPPAASAGTGTLPTEVGGGGRIIRGAVYVSCAGRGGAHFGAPHAELQLVRHALGDVPLVGFFAGGEIAHRHVYGYTGVLTVFTAPTA